MDNLVSKLPVSADAPAGQQRLCPLVESEIGQLKTVIVHRPGREIERLTPQNHDELLFDDLLSPLVARSEHDQFSALMQSNGVQVLQFRDLLEETLRNQQARAHILKNTVNRLRLGPLLAPALEEWAAHLPPAQVASLCLEGMNLGEWKKVSGASSLVAKTMDDEDFLISPLPNHLFTRDASVWLYGGVAINSMNRLARQRESLHYQTIYDWHPLFSGHAFAKWTNGTSGSVRSVEGGDILVLGNGVLAVGMSERTTPQGVERLTSRLFATGQANRVVAVMLPHVREYMHLDTVLTQVDTDAFMIFPGIVDARTICLSRDGDEVRLELADRPLHQALEEELGMPLRFIKPEGTASEIAREQWNDGFNLLALVPGKVVSYNRTPRSIKALHDEGIEVLEIEGSELVRGRGGPRCMTCPVTRLPLQ